MNQPVNPGSEPEPQGAVPAPAAPQSSSSNGAEKRRIVKTVEDVVFYTDTDSSNYPAFLRNVGDAIEITLKKRLHGIVATFYVKEVTTVNESIEHPLLEEAKKAIKEITKTADDNITAKLRIVYEVYLGDMEKLVADDVTAYAIIVTSKYAPGWDSKAWAIAFDWKKRIANKYPKLTSYVYVKEGRRGPYVAIKLPVASEELAKAFASVMANITVHHVSTVDLESQIENLKRLIKQKEVELEELKKQLEALETKLRLERLKEGVIA